MTHSSTNNSTFRLIDDVTGFLAYFAAAGLVLSYLSKSFNKKYGKLLNSIITILFIINIISVLIHLAYEYYISKLFDPDNNGEST